MSATLRQQSLYQQHKDGHRSDVITMLSWSVALTQSSHQPLVKVGAVVTGILAVFPLVRVIFITQWFMLLDAQVQCWPMHVRKQYFCRGILKEVLFSPCILYHMFIFIIFTLQTVGEEERKRKLVAAK